MKKKLIFTLLSFTFFMASPAQEQTDNYLQDIAKVVKELRKSNNSTRNSAITTLSAGQKLTLMDEIKWAGDEEEKANEVKGAKGNRFKLNQVVAYVYKKQNHMLESKGDMLNGNEKDIFRLICLIVANTSMIMIKEICYLQVYPLNQLLHLFHR